MEEKKRPLKLSEKILLAFAILLLISSLPWFTLQFYDAYDYAAAIAWMCVSMANFLINCIRWESRTKATVVFLCWWSFMFVFETVQLIVYLVS